MNSFLFVCFYCNVDICVHVNTLFKNCFDLGHSELQKSQGRESNLFLIFHYMPNHYFHCSFCLKENVISGRKIYLMFKRGKS